MPSVISKTQAYCLLVASYIVTGKLSLLMAVPPGYASPIFPPAGIAVAAMQIAGPVTLPWTFLGSFLLNLWVGARQTSVVAVAAAAVVIAASSTLQAAISGMVLRSAIGYPMPLAHARDLWRFLLLSSVCCLTSATLSLGGLSVLGAVPLPHLLTNWVSWWIGDTLGVLITLPLVFVAAGEPRHVWRHRAVPVALPVLLFFALFDAPTAFYLEQHFALKWQTWGVLVAGVISTCVLGASLLLTSGHAHRVEREVEDRTRELQQAQAALFQAQKMEAIGHLTGSIAHDFNNLLTVMTGSATLLRDRAADDVVARRASAIIRAGEHGERLIRQLLAFSRQQTLRPETVDLRQQRHQLGELASRSLREDIEIVVDLPENLWPVTIDPAEFELALLNLGVNARDAMPNGGQLRIEARNVSLPSGDATGCGLTGDFVAVKLSDTGTGMTPEVLAHAFEPYFTTKPVGLGSGLGLSQVYGFAKQSGGTALIESEFGRGTSITLLLPRAMDLPIPPHCPPREPSSWCGREILS